MLRAFALILLLLVLHVHVDDALWALLDAVP
jgi:hypothetical protein